MSGETLVATGLITVQSIGAAIEIFPATTDVNGIEVAWAVDPSQGFGILGMSAWLVGTITLWSSGESSTVNGVTTQTQTSSSAPLNALALTVSWFLLARIVWTVSQGSDHGSLRHEPPARPPTEF